MPRQRLQIVSQDPQVFPRSSSAGLAYPKPRSDEELPAPRGGANNDAGSSTAPVFGALAVWLWYKFGGARRFWTETRPRHRAQYR